MSSLSQEKSALEITNKRARLFSHERSLELIGISAIVILGFYSAGIVAKKVGRKGEPESALTSASNTCWPFFRAVEM